MTRVCVYVLYKSSTSGPIEHKRPDDVSRLAYYDSPLEPHHTHFIFQDGGGTFRSQCEYTTILHIRFTVVPECFKVDNESQSKSMENWKI